MKILKDLPRTIPIFPLSNFIIFPKTTVPLNIFEPRYIQMIDDSMKSHRMIGIVQPKKSAENEKPKVYNIGCMGRITSFNETEDGRYLIILNGVSRFEILEELKNEKLYRTCNVDFSLYKNDFSDNKITKEDINLGAIFKNLKSLFKKQGYVINWKDLEKQSVDQTINTLAMASPFSLEEKQILLETLTINNRKEKLEEILKTYIFDEFSNTTLQ